MQISFVLISFASFAAAHYNYNNGYSTINITSPPFTNWGVWGPYEKCPEYTYAQAIQLNHDFNHAHGADFIGLSTIKLFCGNPTNPNTPTITSTQGPNRIWGSIYSCYPGYIYAFQLQVNTLDSRVTNGDSSATDNIKVICNVDGDIEQLIECDGKDERGIWTDLVQCPCDHAICAIQTQMDEGHHGHDDTALNNVLFGCCEFCSKYSDEDEYDF